MLPQLITDALNLQKRFFGCQDLREEPLVVQDFQFVEVLIRVPRLQLHELVVGQFEAGVLQIEVILIILGAIA